MKFCLLFSLVLSWPSLPRQSIGGANILQLMLLRADAASLHELKNGQKGVHTHRESPFQMDKDDTSETYHNSQLDKLQKAYTGETYDQLKNLFSGINIKL